MSESQQPHDQFAKHLISLPDSARSIVREYLPRDVVKLLDLKSLSPSPTSWVDDDLKEHLADCLFRCRWAKGLRSLGVNLQPFVLLLVEHKSHQDKSVAVQILRYSVQCWTEHLKDKSQPLPIIIPLVLYHGASRWTFSPRFESLFGEIPEELLRFVPHFEFQLLDVSPKSDTEIVGDPLTRVSLKLLRHAREPDAEAFKSGLPNILADLPPELATQLKYMLPILHYVSSARMLNVADMGEVLERAFPQRGQIMRSFVDELIEKGMTEGVVKGRKEGLELGREEGREEGRAEMAVQLLQQRFGEKAISKPLATKVAKLSLAQLKQLGDQLLKFQSVADLQRWLASHG